jgi:histidinol-phosphate aminotransferase
MTKLPFPARALPVRPEIRALAAYSLTPDASVPIRAKLDFNESPFDVPPEMKAAVLERLGARRWALYPEFGANRLREAIAGSIGRRPEEILPGNGSSEVILAAASVFAGGGDLVLAPPTFSLYSQIAAIASASRVEVRRLGSGFDLDEEAFLAAVRARPRAVPLVCSPNNPTGGTVSRDFLRRLAGEAGVVLLDQAYVDFAGPADDHLSLIDECPNVVVFRTLSKAFSAAGFRIGYAVARPEAVREIQKAVLPFNIDHAAEELAVALLAAPELSRARVAVLVAERERVSRALSASGLPVAPSRANFLFFAAPGGRAGEVRSALLSRGILIRDMTAASPGRLRVSIGAPAENDLFLEALGSVLKELS